MGAVKNDTDQSVPMDRSRFFSLMISALGVVFGDIGTSPLYALRECFRSEHGLVVDPPHVLGILSLIFWALILVISIKYIMYVMSADNRGEGGVLALTALLHRSTKGASGSGLVQVLILLGLFGAALLYGDGVITPAISVLSAVEGLEIVTPLFEPYVVPITITILIGLFVAQSRGTGSIGAVFGPVILFWFVVLGIMGVRGIMQFPAVFEAINPAYAWSFLIENRWHAFVTLGSVFLVMTGGEALYADMGHFGKTPIRWSWFTVVLPALVLNYFGQGAMLMVSPENISHPFYRLAPQWAIFPLVVLATLSTVIASQALITGAYSITKQAMQLGFLPRFMVRHTSEEEAGQIYVPGINWGLLCATIFLVLFFRTSGNLAAAYGLAVSLTMVITAILIFFVSIWVWKWPLWLAVPVTIAFLILDGTFLGANLLKIHDGGWFPLLVGGGICLLMTTWRRGRKILAERLKSRLIPLDQFLDRLDRQPPVKVPGIAIFMTSTLEGTPPALVHNIQHNKMIHDKVVLMMIKAEEVPHVPWADRIVFRKVRDDFYTLEARYGFLDTPNVPAVLLRCPYWDFNFLLSEVAYFLGRETIIATAKPGMALWRERIFAFMSRNALRATDYFRIPSNQVVEIGIQIEM